ncbi:hypothetical protein EI555_021062, partial [Monodon monoceros]
SEGKPAGPLEGAEWAAETPEPRYGGGEGASPVWTARVGELRAERVWPPGRRAGARAVAHVLRPQAGTTRPLTQAVPRRLRQAPAPGPETGAHGAGAGGEGPKRPPFCPFSALDQQPRAPGAELPTNRGVDLAVAVVLQSSDQTVLLTRRTCALNVSPNLWVPPGGHVEPDEELLDGGLRELWEESGLQLPQGQFFWVPLGLWEESQQQLQARIQPNPREVNALMWLGPDVAAAVAATEDGTETPRHLPQDLPPSVLAVELEENGGARPLVLPTSTLLRTTPATADSKERVSTGTKFALRLWLQHLGSVGLNGLVFLWVWGKERKKELPLEILSVTPLPCGSGAHSDPELAREEQRVAHPTPDKPGIWKA